MQTARQIADLEGFSLTHDGRIADSGRFEGERVDILYWYDAYMDGQNYEDDEGNALFDITNDDRLYVDAPTQATTAVLFSDDNGFWFLRYR